MSTRSIVNGFALVVAVLIGLGVWGWYASDDSRAEVERIREAHRLEVFCEEYRGVDDLERIYGPVLIPETTVPVPVDPTGPGPGIAPPTSWAYEPVEPVELVDLERLARNAPKAIEEEVEEVTAAVKEMRQTGNQASFADPAVRQSVQEITDYGATRCR